MVFKTDRFISFYSVGCYYQTQTNTNVKIWKRTSRVIDSGVNFQLFRFKQFVSLSLSANGAIAHSTSIKRPKIALFYFQRSARNVHSSPRNPKSKQSKVCTWGTNYGVWDSEFWKCTRCWQFTFGKVCLSLSNEAHDIPKLMCLCPNCRSSYSQVHWLKSKQINLKD